MTQASSLVQYQSTATIECYRPGNTSPYGPRDVITSADPAPEGTPCSVFYYAPVTFQNMPRYMQAVWRSPNGDSKSARVDPESSGNLVSTSGIRAATNNVFAVYVREGTFQNQQCNGPQRWVNFCREGMAGPVEDPCIFSQAHLITASTSPPPSIAPYVAQVVGSLRAQAGSIRSLPSPNGLVNLPTCFWIEGIGVPDERAYTLVLAGPPDASGRRIYYTYLIRVFFDGVEWDFDDPYGNQEVQPHPACGQRSQLTAHSYQLISEKRNAEGLYQVRARERYQVTVDMYWDDTYGPHRRAVDPGVPVPIVVEPPGPYLQYVGQVEAIPMSR